MDILYEAYDLNIFCISNNATQQVHFFNQDFEEIADYVSFDTPDARHIVRDTLKDLVETRAIEYLGDKKDTRAYIKLLTKEINKELK